MIGQMHFKHVFILIKQTLDIQTKIHIEKHLTKRISKNPYELKAINSIDHKMREFENSTDMTCSAFKAAGKETRSLEWI